MEMSELSAEEVFEITDTSIANLADKTEIETSKRPYSPDLDNDEDKDTSVKKFKEDAKIEPENDGIDITASVNATSSETDILNETQEISVEEEPTEEPSVLDKTNESESMLEEVVSDGEEKENVEDDDDDDEGEIVAGNGRGIDSESDEDVDEEIEDEETENSSDEDEDDDALMKRAVDASISSKPMMSFDEPIALDSTDSEASEAENEEDIEERPVSPIYERVNPFPMSYRTRMLRFSPRFYLYKKILKRSIKTINLKPATKSTAEGPSSATKEDEIIEDATEVVEEVTTKVLETKESTEKVEEVQQKDAIEELPKEQEKESPQVSVEVMQVDEKPVESKQPEINEKEKATSDDQKTKNERKVENSFNADESSQAQDTFDQECNEINFLLTEISKSSIDEILSRYVLNNSDSNSSVPPAMEDFTEKLFICLQQNKHDIQKAQQVWNEKLHVKYKIREIMERMRRHRVVVDIESFGYKPAHDNPIISSKSSTTNSENDHLLEKSSRMSTESVSRLIQDVRANVLKRDEKQNHIEASFDESNPFANLTPNQGRRGQIIDVQSIVNDFRQKNPQEIPRRGRRFKNSFGGNNSMMESQRFSPYPRVDGNSHKSNNSSGFPEVSLLPVNSFYKSLPQPTGNSPFGQKSSLLQSILTKSTKSPIGLQHVNNSSGTSSTLARLLTAPERERTLQQHNSTPRQMSMGGPSRQSNGEITITPIQPGTSRKQEYSMDDEENSTDGHLVIDESDFDLSERKSDMLLCQGCRRHKALFMCAGCSKQWYCSKECQEMAWDEHAELCMG